MSQMRLRPMGGGVLGLDLSAILAVSAVNGYDQKSVFDILSDVEPVIVSQINSQLETSS